MPPARLTLVSGGLRRTLETYGRIAGKLDVVLPLILGAREDPRDRSLLGGIRPLNIYFGPNIFRIVVDALKLMLAGLDSDVIVCYSNFPPSLDLAYLFALATNKPLITTVQDRLGGLDFVSRMAIQRSAGVLTLDNKALIEEVRTIFPRVATSPITNGVDVAWYSPDDGGSSNRQMCLSIGTLGPRKGSDLLIQVWSAISKSTAAQLHVLVGKSDERSIRAFLDAAEARKAGHGLSVTRYVDESEKRRILRSACVMLCTSVYEGFGLAIAESLACGVPVVLWDLPSFDRFEAGVVKIPFPDTQLFANAILDLLGESARRDSLAKAGREYAITQLSWSAASALEVDSILRILGTLGKEPTPIPLAEGCAQPRPGSDDDRGGCDYGQP